MSVLRFITIMSAAAAIISLSGCASATDGKYVGGTKTDDQTSFENRVSGLPQTPGITLPESSATEPVTELPEPSEPFEETESVQDSEPEESVSDISDVIEPLSTVAERDYSALDTALNGYGQGVRFDELNRPKGAVEFNDRYSKYNAAAIQSTEEKVINLTFDQGYENGFTSKILDVLKEKGVKATFFVVGDYAERQPELVERMINEGHTVGSHSVNHYSMPELSVEEMTDEIMGLHEYMLEHFGIQMTLFRPPKGEYSELSLAVTGDLGYKTVLWSFAYADWDTDDQPDPEAALSKLIERAHPGAIYLLHSVSETNASILGDFIDAMLAEGYTFGCDFD